MQGQPEILPATLLLGVILIIAGALLILIPLLSRVVEGLERIHPLILIGMRLDGIFVGTSPIVIIALLIVYLLFRLSRG
ncbi:MAG: hypothetical protein QW756_02500 [Nitrososphaerota archaeon]